MSSIDISILLPSRGRTQQLARSVTSLINHADHPESIEWLLAFDSDDTASSEYFIDNIAPLIEDKGGHYTCFVFEPMGYGRLNHYLNGLAPNAQAPWWVFWNDDAVMLDDHWDTVISSHGDRFCVQAFDTHRQHPYSIFPIVPKAWYDVLGHLSQHPLNDAYISQIAWMMDIMVRLDIRVDHQRFDLTGENLDDTYRARDLRQLEGNPNNPLDFNFITQRKARFDSAKKLAEYLRPRNHDLEFFDAVCQGRQDPWVKMLAADVNKQMMRFS